MGKLLLDRCTYMMALQRGFGVLYMWPGGIRSQTTEPAGLWTTALPAQTLLFHINKLCDVYHSWNVRSAVFQLFFYTSICFMRQTSMRIWHLHRPPARSKFISWCKLKDIAFAGQDNSSRHVYGKSLFSWDSNIDRGPLFDLDSYVTRLFFLESVFTIRHNNRLNTSGVNFHGHLISMLAMKRSREEMHSNDPICLRMEINSVLSNSGWVTGLARGLDFPTAPSLHFKLTSYIKRPPIRS